MSLTTTDQQFTDAESTLQEPHFDQEATVLSARPVVPLATVEAARAKSSFPRPWLLGLGLIGALFVGIAATAIYYSRPGGNGRSALQDTEIAAGVAGQASDPANVFAGAASARPTVSLDPPAEVKRQTPKNQPDRASNEQDKARPRLVAVIRDRKSNNHTEEESREDRKAARKQARQERRRAERERRDGRSSDELLRIRDIFEGSPRP